jgi:hypothetical protein
LSVFAVACRASFDAAGRAAALAFGKDALVTGKAALAVG